MYEENLANRLARGEKNCWIRIVREIAGDRKRTKRKRTETRSFLVVSRVPLAAVRSARLVRESADQMVGIKNKLKKKNERKRK